MREAVAANYTIYILMKAKLTTQMCNEYYIGIQKTLDFQYQTYECEILKF